MHFAFGIEGVDPPLRARSHEQIPRGRHGKAENRLLAARPHLARVPFRGDRQDLSLHPDRDSLLGNGLLLLRWRRGRLGRAPVRGGRRLGGGGRGRRKRRGPSRAPRLTGDRRVDRPVPRQRQ